MSFSTSSRSVANCSLACWSVKVSFSFCEIAWFSCPLVSKRRSSSDLHAFGAFLEPSPERDYLFFGLDQPSTHGLKLGERLFVHGVYRASASEPPPNRTAALTLPAEYVLA